MVRLLILAIGACIRCCLLPEVGAVNSKASSPHREQSPQQLDRPTSSNLAPVTVAPTDTVPDFLRLYKPNSKSKRPPPTSQAEYEEREKKRLKSARAWQRRKTLGNGSYFPMRTEHKLRWLPPEIAAMPQTEVHRLRLQKLGLRSRQKLPDFARGLPWRLVERVEEQRKQNPQATLEEIVLAERARWEEQLKADARRDPLEGRTAEQLAAAAKKALALRQHAQNRRAAQTIVGKKRRKVRTSKQVSIVGRLEALQKAGLASAAERQVVVDAAGPSHTADETDASQEGPRRQREPLPFDLNRSPSPDRS